jgi:hypothetical protein
MPLFAFAVGGLVVGHALSYLIAVPDPYHRDLALASTGHGYLPTLTELAVVLVLAAAASVAGRAFRRGPAAEPSFGALWVRLAALQVVAFAGQEVAERLLAHVSLADLITDHLLVIGIATQIVVALVGAAILRLLVRTAAAVGERVRSGAAWPRAATIRVVPTAGHALPRRLDAAAIAVRGPPAV